MNQPNLPDIGTVTGEQILDAMIRKNITHVDHHDCMICGEMVFYYREGDQLFFNSGCGCCSAPPRLCDWEEPAKWVNMQIFDGIKRKLAKRFGLLDD